MPQPAHTLAYRLRQIESTIERTLQDTADIATLWIAMNAWDEQSPE